MGNGFKSYLDAIEHWAKGDQTKAESLSNIAAKMMSKGQENLEKEQHSGAVFVPYFLLNARYKGLIQTQGITKNFPCKKPSGSNNKKMLRAGVNDSPTLKDCDTPGRSRLTGQILSL